MAHGAVTIVNAIALGKGAAFGVDLWTKAEVKLTDNPALLKQRIASDPNESTILIEKTVMRVLQRFKLEKVFGAKVKTNIKHPHRPGTEKQQCSRKRNRTRNRSGAGQNP